MKSKKAILGSIMVTFVATIIIILVLVLFAFGSTIYKKFSGISNGIKITNKNDVGLDNIDSYTGSFYNLKSFKYFLSARKVNSDNTGFLEAINNWNSNNKDTTSSLILYYISGSHTMIKISKYKYDNSKNDFILDDMIFCDEVYSNCNSQDVISKFGGKQFGLYFPVSEFYYKPFDNSLIKIEVQRSIETMTNTGGVISFT